MNPVSAAINRLLTSFGAFRESFMTYGKWDAPNYDTFEARQARYRLYWAIFEGTIYRNIHQWSKSFLAEYGLYRNSRAIMNPGGTIADIWQNMIWSGTLDPQAGNGKATPSAIPVITTDQPADAELRIAIARLWADSRMQILKDTLPLYGTTLGDCGLKIEDDVEHGAVRIAFVHPSIIEDVDTDSVGNIKGYQFQERRLDPRQSQVTATSTGQSAKYVLYTESCKRSGGDVVYKTYLDGELYAWNGGKAQWTQPYGFVPLVLIKHLDTGAKWGMSEFFKSYRKMIELDHLFSLLDDQIAKLVNTPFYFAGAKSGEVKVVTHKRSSQTETEAQAEMMSELVRQRLPALYGPAGSTVTPLTGNLDIAGTLAAIDKLWVAIEYDHPELRADKLTVQGGLTGRALALAQQPAEVKVGKVRPHYDDALMRITQMGITVGAMRANEWTPREAGTINPYLDYAPFNENSYRDGSLDFTIDGARPVFQRTREDELERNTAFYDLLSSAMSVGANIDQQLGVAFVYKLLKHYGWSDDDLAEIDLFRQALLIAQQMNQAPTIEGENPLEIGADHEPTGSTGSQTTAESSASE